MNEVIICIHGTDVSEACELLANGWRVKAISSFCQPVAKGREYGDMKGDFGAYIVFTRGEV